jgi:hypothetical protein
MKPETEETVVETVHEITVRVKSLIESRFTSVAGSGSKTVTAALRWKRTA